MDHLIWGGKRLQTIVCRCCMNNWYNIGSTGSEETLEGGRGGTLEEGGRAGGEETLEEGRGGIREEGSRKGGEETLEDGSWGGGKETLQGGWEKTSTATEEGGWERPRRPRRALVKCAQPYPHRWHIRCFLALWICGPLVSTGR